MTDHIRTLSEMAPDARLLLSERRAAQRRGQVSARRRSRSRRSSSASSSNGWLNIVGGCCGTTAAHIKAIAEMAEGKRPRAAPPSPHRAYYSGIDLVEAEECSRPLIVGERTNVIGSRLFKNLVAEEKWEEATEIARRQVRNGAHIIDVCLQSTDRDEIAGHPALLREADPQDQSADHDRHHRPEGGRAGAHLLPGQERSSTRSTSRTAKRSSSASAPSRKRYGAALVVGSIDEDKLQAQAFTRERKLAVAERSVPAAHREVRHPARGHHHRPAGVSLRHRRRQLHRRRGRDHRRHPADQGEAAATSKTVLGISNISFGLPAAAREVVNSVFLYYCTKAGLDLAIVNAEKLERFASIPEEERRLAENLLFNSPPVDAGRSRAPRPRTGASRRRAEGRHQPVAHRRHHRALPQGRQAREERTPPTCRSTSGWRTTSSKAPRTA